MALRIELWGPPLAPLTGGNVYDRMLVEALDRRGHEVTLREFTGVGPEPPAASGRADVILQDELLHREFRRRNAAAKGRRPRIIALVHHLQSSEPERGESQRGRLREEERAYLRTVDGVLAPSRASAAAARELAGRPLPFAVAPPGRDRFAGAELPPRPDATAIRARAAGPLRAAFVGNLIPRKRLLELLEGLAPVSDWSLSVAGREDMSPGYAAEAQRRAAARDLSGRVQFHGALGPAALADLLRKSTVLAVPSTHEGFGIVYLEGFAFGLPALAAASGGASEIVNDGETGWRIRPSVSRAASVVISDCLRRLAADRDRLAAMALRAVERHRIHPTWEESAAAAETFFTLQQQDSLRLGGARNPPPGENQPAEEEDRESPGTSRKPHQLEQPESGGHHESRGADGPAKAFEKARQPARSRTFRIETTAPDQIVAAETDQERDA